MTMTSNKGRLQIVVVALMMALCVSFVHAAEFNITDCINITQPGTYTLQNDIDITGVSMSYAGAALNVNACINIQNVSSIVVDCQGYRIHGNVTDGSGGSIITLASDTEGANITVKNCVIDVENNQSSPNGDLYVLAFVPIASTNFGTIVVENNTISVLTSASGAYSEAMIMWDSSAVGQTVTVRNNHLSAKGHYALGVDLQTSSVNDVYGNDVYVETVDVVSPAIYIASGGIGSAWNNTINTASDYCGISNALLFAFNNSLMGNAYLRPNGTGFSQTCTNNGSGVCTQSYNVSGLGSAVDYLPIALNAPGAVVTFKLSTYAGMPLKEFNVTVNGTTYVVTNYSVDVSGLSGVYNATFVPVLSKYGTAVAPLTVSGSMTVNGAVQLVDESGKLTLYQKASDMTAPEFGVAYTFETNVTASSGDQASVMNKQWASTRDVIPLFSGSGTWELVNSTFGRAALKNAVGGPFGTLWYFSPTSKMMVATLVKTNATNSGHLFLKINEYEMWMDGADGRVHWRPLLNGSWREVVSGQSINDDQWHSVIGMYNGTHVSVIVDGVANSTVFENGVFPGQAYGQLRFGRDNDNAYGNELYPGMFDNIVVLRDASLNQNEIDVLVAGGTYPFTPDTEQTFVLNNTGQSNVFGNVTNFTLTSSVPFMLPNGSIGTSWNSTTGSIIVNLTKGIMQNITLTSSEMYEEVFEYLLPAGGDVLYVNMQHRFERPGYAEAFVSPMHYGTFADNGFVGGGTGTKIQEGYARLYEQYSTTSITSNATNIVNYPEAITFRYLWSNGGVTLGFNRPNTYVAFNGESDVVSMGWPQGGAGTGEVKYFAAPITRGDVITVFLTTKHFEVYKNGVNELNSSEFTAWGNAPAFGFQTVYIAQGAWNREAQIDNVVVMNKTSAELLLSATDAYDGSTISSGCVNFTVGGVQAYTTCDMSSLVVPFGVYNVSLYNMSGYYDPGMTQVDLTNDASAVFVVGRLLSVDMSNATVYGRTNVRYANASQTLVSYDLGGPTNYRYGSVFTPYSSGYLAEYVSQDGCGASAYTKKEAFVTYLNGTVLGSATQKGYDINGKFVFVFSQPVYLEGNVSYQLYYQYPTAPCQARYTPGVPDTDVGIGNLTVLPGQTTLAPFYFVNVTMFDKVPLPLWNGSSTQVGVEGEMNTLSGLNGRWMDAPALGELGGQLDGRMNETSQVQYSNGTVVVATPRGGKSFGIPMSALVPGQNTFVANVSKDVNGVRMYATDAFSFNVSMLTFPGNVQPSGGVVFLETTTVSWDAATGNASPVTYDVWLNLNSTEQLVASDVTGTSVVVNVTETGNGSARVVAKDGLVNVSASSASPFNVTFLALNASLVSPADLTQTLASRVTFVVSADTGFDFADSVCIDVAGDMRCQYNVTLPANVSFNVTNLTPGVSVWNATISLFNYTNTTSSRSIEYVLTNQSYSYALQLLNGTFSQSLPFCEGAECTTSVLRRNATVGQVVNVVLVPNASGYYLVNSTFAAGTERARHVLDPDASQFLSPLQFTYVGLSPLVSENMFGTKQALVDSQSYTGWQGGGADGQTPYFGAYREDLMPFSVDGLTFINSNADDMYHVDDYLVQGSDDNNTWIVLANVTGRGNSSVRKEAVAFENNHAYVYYRVQVLKWGNGTTYADGLAVGELYLHRDRAYVDDGFVAEFDSSIEGFTHVEAGVALPQVTQDQIYARNGSLKVVGGDWQRNISTPRGKRLVAYVYDANYTSGPILYGGNGVQAVGFGRTGLLDGCGFNCPGRFTGIMMADWMPNYYGIAYAKYPYTSRLIQTSIPRSVGWHKFETEILENGTLTFKIDDVVAYTIYSNYQISPMRGREEYGKDIQSDTVSLSNWYVSNPLYVDRMKLEVIHPYRTQEVVQVSVISGDSVGAYVNLTTFSDVAGPAGGDGCFEGFIYTPNKDTHLTEVKFDTNYPSTYGQGPDYYYVYNDPDGYARQTQVGGNNWSWIINNGHVGMAPVGDVADVQDARLSNGSYRPSMLFMANSTYVIGKYNILGCGLHFIAPKVNVSSPIGLFEQISAFYSTAHGHPANVLYVTGVAVENDTYVWNGTSTRFGAAVIDNVVLAANRSLLVDGLTEGARASDHDISTVAAGVKNVSGVVSFYVGDVLMNVGASSVGVVTKMSPVDVLSPSGNITTKYQQVQWTPATEGATAPVYNVIYNNGTVNVSVASGLTSENVSYNFSGVNVPAGQMYVVATDGYVTLTSLSLFSLNLSTSVTQTWCEAGVVPNELDQPSVVLMHFNATTHSELEGLPEFASVENGISNATCTYVNGTNDTRRWSCAMPMHYWYTAGNYTANFQFDSVNASTSACQYAQLLAFQRPTPYVTFPSSAPGVNDAPGNVPVTVRNTGNAPFDTFVTAQDLNGRAVPALKLLASKFKMGQNLSVAVPMVHNVAVNVSSPLAPAQGAETNVSIWLSMPANQTMQEYYTVTPWVLTVQ